MDITKAKLVHYLFTTALEGGIDYWSVCDSYRWSIGDGETEDLDNFQAVIVESDEDYEHGENAPKIVIDGKVIRRGLRLAGTPEVYNRYSVYALKDTAMAYRFGGERLDDLDYDSTTADAIVQLGLFGEIVYG